jgi:hypothetical protein
MRTLLKSALAAGLVLTLAAPVRGQVPGIGLKINPRIGLYVPLTDLGEQTVGSTTVTVAMESSLAIGLGLELDLPLVPVNFRANLDYATGSRVQEGDTAGDGGETTLLALVADVVFRPLPRVVVAQPYLFAGGGFKQYDPTDAQSFQSGSDPTIHLGAGLDVGLGPLAFNAELGDYLSWFQITEGADSKMQHDLFVTIGFSIGLL